MTSEAKDDEIQALTPDQQLAETVTEALMKEGFVTDARKLNFVTKLAAGQLKAEDWRTYAAAVIVPVSEGAA